MAGHVPASLHAFKFPPPPRHWSHVLGLARADPRGRRTGCQRVHPHPL